MLKASTSQVEISFVLFSNTILQKPSQPSTLTPLDSSPSFQILFDLCCVCAKESLQFLVELGISFIDVVHVSILVVCTPSAVFGSLFNSKKERGMLEQRN